MQPATRSALKKPSCIASTSNTDHPVISDEPSETKPRKRIRIESTPVEDVVVFNHLNPANRLDQTDLVDILAIEKEDERKELRRRLQVAQLSAERTHLPSNHQQAFSIFALPVVVDTQLLSLKELQAELRVRGLRTTGPKKQLAVRLDKYLLQHERDRCIDSK
jgi:hypothetical protein